MAKKKARKKAAPKAKKRKAAKKAVRKKAPARRKAAKKRAGPKKKRKLNPAMMMPLMPSAALAKVVGAKPLPRSQVVKKLWQYIKRHDLQDKVNRRNVHADDNLRPVFAGKRVVNMFEMTKLVSKHLKK
jgi:chromatin remodeling complex protein RSC6